METRIDTSVTTNNRLQRLQQNTHDKTLAFVRFLDSERSVMVLK